MTGSFLKIVISLLLVYPISRVLYNIFFSPLKHVPGPTSWAATRLPFIWGLLRGTIVHDFEKLHRKYGPIVRTAPDEVSIASGEGWTAIYASRPPDRQFLKDPVWWRRQPGQPDSLLSAISPDKHAAMRRLLAPAFTQRALRTQEEVLQKFVSLLVARIREQVEAADGGKAGAQIDIAPWFNFTTFDIFGDLGFGESFNCLQDSEYHPWIALLFNSVKAASVVAAARYYPLLEWLLMKCIPKSLAEKGQRHYQQIVDKVDRRLSWELQRPDIMSHLIDKDSGQVVFPRGELNATFMILTTTGSETTATVLTGILAYLVNNPKIMGRLVSEIRGNFQSSMEISLAAATELPYLTAVIEEGLRLCPPVPWMLPRQVPSGGDSVCGTWLPEGTSVSLQAYTLNRDPSRFHAATSFCPERWLADASSNPDSPFYHDDRRAVQPFSMGPRNCLGQHLAWAEMRLILAKLLLAFDFEAVEGKQLQWEELRTFLLVEKRPLEVRVRLAGP
ncbi:cytochrome P450 [Aspergillus fijiensis CBS 313.89]|uniref:Cytochrome P450 n=1 Tax=Aspergillus fijiensis CBS 313.89 TaxID=1448319 RepID=A0A8G1W6W7_9EURO|nr:cytochrome P450 [Aspergillus fijiensis CBS 313.89]RAK82729.1 cytochrome P450 [Aspergillus fijiensis CBS 313.89]